MSVAWATIIIVALLFPGAGFLIGLSLKDRFSQEIIRTGALGEISIALFLSVIIHLIAYAILGSFLAPIVSSAVFEHIGPHEYPHKLERFAILGAIYCVFTALIAFILGAVTADCVKRGWIRFLSRYPWTNELQNRNGDIIKVYLMTKTISNNKILMYSGLLSEFYLNNEGCFTYIVIQNCSRYFMDFNSEAPNIGTQLSLFNDIPIHSPKWNYLTIQGDNIANVLFDKVGSVDESEAGTAALKHALKDETPGAEANDV